MKQGMLDERYQDAGPMCTTLSNLLQSVRILSYVKYSTRPSRRAPPSSGATTRQLLILRHTNWYRGHKLPRTTEIVLDWSESYLKHFHPLLCYTGVWWIVIL